MYMMNHQTVIMSEISTTLWDKELCDTRIVVQNIETRFMKQTAEGLLTFERYQR